ncbi:sensor histidine kinase [Desulfacinum hydrothermale]|nr:HAMP domain-containing histidine kinase [Desulfacinum hydrothermale]
MRVELDRVGKLARKGKHFTGENPFYLHIAGVIHDLRNMLMVLGAHVDMMRMSPRKASEYYPKIKELCKCLQNMCSDCMDFMMKDSLSKPGVDTEVNLVDTLENIVHVLEHVVPQHIKFVVKMNIHRSVCVPVRSIDVQRMVANLIRNSIEAIGENRGEIVLECRFWEGEPIRPKESPESNVFFFGLPDKVPQELCCS